jgi:hypothetical protein
MSVTVHLYLHSPIRRHRGCLIKTRDNCTSFLKDQKVFRTMRSNRLSLWTGGRQCCAPRRQFQFQLRFKATPLSSRDKWIAPGEISFQTSKYRHTYLTYLLTELSPSWGAANCAAPQEFPNISRNQTVHCRVHKSPPPVPILSHINPIHTIPSYLSIF